MARREREVDLVEDDQRTAEDSQGAGDERNSQEGAFQESERTMGSALVGHVVDSTQRPDTCALHFMTRSLTRSLTWSLRHLSVVRVAKLRRAT